MTKLASKGGRILLIRILGLVLLACLALPGGISAASSTGQHVLAKAGKTDYAIIVDDAARAAELTAAAELKKYLEKSTGAAFPLLKSSKATAFQRRIHVGMSREVLKLLPELREHGTGIDGIVIGPAGSDLILAGDYPRGSLYAVYTFLQQSLGCRWYAEDMDEIVPRHDELAVNVKKQIYTPPFRLRWLYTVVARSGEKRDPLFPAKFRLNGGERGEAYGRGLLYGGAHTMTQWVLPPSIFFKEHPEWYALNKQGVRTPEAPCYTRPEALKMATQRVLERVKKLAPEWRFPNEKIVSVSHPDAGQHCLCPECERAHQRYGSHAGALLKFVNSIAAAVAAVDPEVKISTLAYWNTAQPPVDLRASDNVLIHFGIAKEALLREGSRGALVKRDFRKPFDQNERLAACLRAWTGVARNVYVWDYTTNFRNFLLPHPTYFAFPESVKYYRKLGISGIFSQGGWAAAGDFPQMAFWVGSQMLWNPDLDPRTLIAEFLNAYYGNAGPVLNRYLEMMASVDSPLGSYDRNTSSWLSLELLNRATQLFNEAEEVVQEAPEHLFRVRRARVGVDLVWLEQYRELKAEADRRGVPFLGSANVQTALKKLQTNEFNIKAYREWGDFEEYVSKLKAKYEADDASR